LSHAPSTLSWDRFHQRRIQGVQLGVVVRFFCAWTDVRRGRLRSADRCGARRRRRLRTCARSTGTDRRCPPRTSTAHFTNQIARDRAIAQPQEPGMQWSSWQPPFCPCTTTQPDRHQTFGHTLGHNPVRWSMRILRNHPHEKAPILQAEAATWQHAPPSAPSAPSAAHLLTEVVD